ncbi:MAG: nucleoside triphosphate pyrophosphohydrolase family protein [Candidatus Saccharimonadales bacterium]
MDEYQTEALKTDKTYEMDELKALMLPLLGLADETGSVLTEFKKHIVDGDHYRIFRSRVSEELGDILWYLANLASKEDIKLSEIAEKNLIKNRDRWGTSTTASELFDENCPPTQQLPRIFEVFLIPREVDGKKIVRVYVNGIKCGDEIDDNSYVDDGYRFHDVFHFSYVAYLGWSPVIRKLLECKRKKDPDVDRIQDGARARVIEEAISAMVFNFADDYSFFEHGGTVTNALLNNIKSLTSHLEVKRRTNKEWEKAIVSGFDIWRELMKNDGGVIMGDMKKRMLRYERKLTVADLAKFP